MDIIHEPETGGEFRYSHTIFSSLVIPRKRDGRLRQSYAPTLHQGITKTCIGDSAFGAAAPRLWNELPVNIRASETMFRKRLKTYLFY